MPKLVSNKLHFAGWVNWYEKCKKLEFYNDEEEFIQRPKRPPKPRRSKYQSEEEYIRRVAKWEAKLPHEQVVILRGNAMTQKYYAERILPVYIKAIYEARLRDPINGILQEDNDPSYGSKGCKGKRTGDLRIPSLYTILKEDN